MIEMTNEDKDLQDIFHGEEKPLHPDTVHITLGQPTAKAETKKCATKAKNETEKEKPVDAQWKPVKPTPNYMDKLKGSVKNMALYAVMSAILFWWQQTGRLEETTAWYALLLCVGMVFFTVGRTWNGVNK
jgi:hypothetical protein